MDSVEKKYLYITHHKVYMYKVYYTHQVKKKKKKNVGIDYIQ